jgi:hypothetical protein
VSVCLVEADLSVKLVEIVFLAELGEVTVMQHGLEMDR